MIRILVLTFLIILQCNNKELALMMIVIMLVLIK